jgi:glucans biosynthesis protein C
MTSSVSTKPAAGRLYFLDWVRIAAFFLLIVYHTGMYYVTWDWHVKSPHASHTIEPLMLLTAPWRLGLLFLVSGAASAFMFGKTRPGRFLRQRSWRLLVPLVFGMLIVVPPQSYLEVVEKVSYGGSYLDFMKLYLSAYHGFCRGDDCLIMPTWNHLWFVAYLWAYTVVLWGAALSFGERFDVWSERLAHWLRGWRALALPALLLAAERLLLAGRFPTTHALVDDWYSHASYFALFALGFLLARQSGFWDTAAALRRTSLAIALVGWAMLAVYAGSFSDTYMPPEWIRMSMRVVFGILQWSAIMAACGFARLYLNRDNGARRYLTQAVFPVYILHQTVIVVFAHALKPAGLDPVVEGILLIATTFALSFLSFEIVRRIRVLRPLFGLGSSILLHVEENIEREREDAGKRDEFGNRQYRNDAFVAEE